VPTITDIRRSGPQSRRRTVVVDGDPWRDVPAAVVSALSLAIADEVETDVLAARIDEAERPLARERALRLLTARERSQAQLLARLIEGGFSPGAAHSTVADLARVGLVDDIRFAHALARTLANARGVGRAGIARDLRAAGIGEDLAAAALDDALGDEDETAAARRIAALAAAKAGATVDRVAARLVRRGYRPPLALTVAREAMRAVADPDDTGPAGEFPVDD
jgi:regulatory protein